MKSFRGFLRFDSWIRPRVEVRLWKPDQKKAARRHHVFTKKRCQCAQAPPPQEQPKLVCALFARSFYTVLIGRSLYTFQRDSDARQWNLKARRAEISYDTRTICLQRGPPNSQGVLKSSRSLTLQRGPPRNQVQQYSLGASAGPLFKLTRNLAVWFVLI